MKKNNKSLPRYLLDLSYTAFLNGLFVLLPIILTFTLFNYVIKILQRILEPIHDLEPVFLHNIPYSELILTIFFIFLTGIIFRSFFLSSLLHLIENTIFKIPLLQQVYFGIKQIVQAFTVQEQIIFKKIVLVEFPRNNIYSVGFLTREIASELSPNPRKKFFNIFIPTTPNPTTGYLIIVPEEDFIIIDLTRQEAMSLIISGGIIQPERFKAKESPTQKREI